MPFLVKVLSVVFPVFAVIGVGYVFARFKKISLEPVLDILIYLTIPALVISSLTKKPLVASDLFVVAAAATAVVAATGLMAYAYLRATGRPGMRGFYLPTMFMNSGNMSFPLALLAFGTDGLAVAVLYYIAISFLVYTLGIYIAKGRGGLKEIFRLPLIYASAIGIALNLGEMEMPIALSNSFDMLGAATIPLMQVSLGYRLYSTHLRHISVSVAGSAIRILGGVAVAWVIVTVFGIGGLNAKIILLSSAMPSAVINFIMSQRYDLDSDIVASTIAASTLMSVFTTPVLLAWIMD